MLALASAYEARADAPVPNRRAWVFEQLSAPAMPTLEGTARYQTSLGLANYSDTLSTQAGALLDLRDVEIGIRASQRVFAALTPRGSAEKRDLKGDRTSLNASVARYYVTRDKHYGRLGLGFTQFLPTNKWRWIDLKLDAGMLETPELPWAFQLHANFFVSVGAPANILVVSGETERAFAGATSTWALGAQFSWTYLVQDNSAFLGLNEHMLFSIGPTLSWKGGLGLLRLFVATRLYLDYESQGHYDSAGKPVVTQSGYPSEWTAVPDVSLSWTVLI